MKKAAHELSAITNRRRHPAKLLVITLILLLLVVGIPASLYFFDSRDNLGLLKHNIMLLQNSVFPVADQNRTELNTKHLPADKD